MDDLTQITPAQLGPFAQLLGLQVVPTPTTAPAVLVVCGKKVSSLAEIEQALGIDRAVTEEEEIENANTLKQLATVYARHMNPEVDLSQGADGNRTVWAERVGDDGLTNKQRSAREYYARNREQIRAYDQARRDAKRAARQAATQPAPEAPADVPVARPKTLEQILAAIDADGTLTVKQKQNRRYIARHRDDLLARKREHYRTHLDTEQARRREVHHQRRARGNQEQQPCA